MKVGKKELYLLLALLGVGIAVLAWQFGFNKLNVKTEALRVETEALQSEITKYTAVKRKPVFLLKMVCKQCYIWWGFQHLCCNIKTGRTYKRSAFLQFIQ